MTKAEDANRRPPSTTWGWKRVKITPPPAGPSSTAPKAPHPRSKGRRDERVPLPVTIKYRGGPECWYEIHARGAVIRVPGYVALHDLMRQINGK